MNTTFPKNAHIEIAPKLLKWYAANGRTLPWRDTTDPYRIWISEIILQQTRVAQGIDYYNRFIAQFPDIAALAQADEKSVMRLWQGLGYYSRARNLHAAAQQVQTLFQGQFPHSHQDVLQLKGIGQYTAAAICSFAFSTPIAAIDGNVYRVLSRLTGIDVPIDTTQGKKIFAELAQAELDKAHPATYNQAIMDFGALQCAPKNPDCQSCPFANQCRAFLSDQVTALPVKSKRTAVKDRYFNYLHISFNGTTFIHQRIKKDIWQHLFDFPLIETDKEISAEELLDSDTFRHLIGNKFTLEQETSMPAHKLSHRTIHAKFYRITISEPSLALKDYINIATTQLQDYALPRLIDRYISSIRIPIDFHLQ